ncbi:TRMT1-like protein [Chionoecetes opilio]|uniref:tRNA (guanine(26)-N(2))-dimethyltransferase n=1 Tax=Chionoecetes opilio TaxID=41210 RepID=A0A8J4XZC4_CHIOP|nr:TRMT1-like protein [Chionoecetes opilio]
MSEEVEEQGVREEVEEHGVRINVAGTFHAPKKNEVMYNAEMLVNRSLVLCALAAYYESGQCTNSQVRCLDALGATGVSGLAWAKHFPKVDVAINDQSAAATERITANAAANTLNVAITAEDVSVLLLQRPFDFVFLDCYGSSVHYLDAAFRNAPKHSLLAITSTDDSALYGKAADVTLRNYGGYVVKTSYAKELAARLVLGSVVRAAAKSNKGVEVVCCVALKSFITVLVRVLRGPAAANKCVRKIRRVIHCCMCEDRAFYPETVYPIEEPYSLLSCDCRSRSAGKLSVELGPVWCDEIFDATFCQAMLTQATNLQLSHKVTSLLQTIVNEAKCSGEPGPEETVGGDKENTESAVAEDRTGGLGEEEDEEEGSHHHPYQSEEDHEGERSPKRLKTDHPALRSPAFYFNLHRHSPKGHDLGKINRVVEYLRRAHHKASRTHFDPAAIRTDCSLRDFTRLLLEFSQAQN